MSKIEKRPMKAYVRFDGTGRIVPSSLILRRKKPKVGKWMEVPAYECCNETTTTAIPTTSTTTTAFVFEPIIAQRFPGELWEDGVGIRPVGTVPTNGLIFSNMDSTLSYKVIYDRLDNTIPCNTPLSSVTIDITWNGTAWESTPSPIPFSFTDLTVGPFSPSSPLPSGYVNTPTSFVLYPYEYGGFGAGSNCGQGGIVYTTGIIQAFSGVTQVGSNVSLPVNAAYWIQCFVEGTLIKLSDGTQISVEDITYNHLLKVWNFDEGVEDESEILWINQSSVANYYWKVVLEDGTMLKLAGPTGHRMFNIQQGKFVYPKDFNTGEQTYKEDGTAVSIVSVEKVEDTVRYYNLETKGNINIFANNTLCGSRFSSIYPIENMKFVKNDRELYERSEFYNIPDEYFYGLRLAEQATLIEERGLENVENHIINNYILRDRKNSQVVTSN